MGKSRTTPTRETHKYGDRDRLDQREGGRENRDGEDRDKLDQREPREALLHALLDQSLVGHFAFVEHGQPRVMPIAIVRDGSDILLHGSTGSPWMRLLSTGVPVALSVAELDAIVVARSAFESSMRFRSAVLFGTCSTVIDSEKAAALDLVTDGLVPGRSAEVRPSTARELAATLVLRMSVEEWSLKVSDGWADDGAPDIAGDAWAGVVPLRRGHENPQPAPDLRAGIPVAPSVMTLVQGYSPE